jgi:tetraacyldisaccharide 4'-kinase
MAVPACRTAAQGGPPPDLCAGGGPPPSTGRNGSRIRGLLLMRPPGFWYADPAHPSLGVRALSPLSRIYAAATAYRLARVKPAALPVPVICVGNLSAGGTGKTPTVMALAGRLAARGIAVHVVTRGYGGRLTGPLLVDPQVHSAAETGDEPLLHAAIVPTWVARDRGAGALAASRSGAEVIILDDGHQNPLPARDLSIVVVDAARGFGNGRVIPAGPLREPLETGLSRADLLIVVGDPPARQAFGKLWARPLSGLTRIDGQIEPLPTGISWSGQDVVAFAGIGDPEKFFATLRGLGARVVRACPLDDHQPISPALLGRLDAEARSLGAALVTTEKDAVRLPARERSRVLTLPVRLRIDDWSLLDSELARLGLARDGKDT